YGGTVGTCRPYVYTYCFTPPELDACSAPDGGVDAGVDGAAGEGPVGGAGGEASGAEPDFAAPIPDSGILPEGGADVPTYACPSGQQISRCGLVFGIMISPPTWNGTTCCYSINQGCI